MKYIYLFIYPCLSAEQVLQFLSYRSEVLHPFFSPKEAAHLLESQ